MSYQVLLSRWTYYLSSIPTLLLGFKPWWRVIATFLGLPVQNPFVVELRDGCRFKVRNKMDLWIIKETCLDLDYEDRAAHIPSGATIIDIGAGLGDFAVRVAREHSESTVFAFEPFPESFRLLQENIALNGLQNVRAIPRAIGAQHGPMTLSTAWRSPVMYSTPERAVAEASSGMQVEGTTLDRVFEEFNIHTCAFMKIDCEGGEYDILFAASRDTLVRVRRIAMEFHDGYTPYSHHDLVRFFEDLGFEVRTAANPAHRTIGLLHASNPALGAVGARR